MRRLTVIAALVLLVAACCMAGSHVLLRIDAAREDSKRAYQHASALRERVEQVHNVYELEFRRVDYELELCRRRTDNLRGVLEVLLGELKYNGRGIRQ